KGTEMPRSSLAWRHYDAAVCIVAMVAAFWVWALAVTRLNVESRGFGAFVTATLWSLYLFGVRRSVFLLQFQSWTWRFGLMRMKSTWPLMQLLILSLPFVAVSSAIGQNICASPIRNTICQFGICDGEGDPATVTDERTLITVSLESRRIALRISEKY